MGAIRSTVASPNHSFQIVTLADFSELVFVFTLGRNCPTCGRRGRSLGLHIGGQPCNRPPDFLPTHVLLLGLWVPVREGATRRPACCPCATVGLAAQRQRENSPRGAGAETQRGLRKCDLGNCGDLHVTDWQRPSCASPGWGWKARGRVHPRRHLANYGAPSSDDPSSDDVAVRGR